MYKYLTLENTPYQVLYETFLDAFKGFRIVTEATFTDFCEMLNSNAYDPMISVGAFNVDNELIAFVLNRIKIVENSKIAYAIIIGTKPMFRRQGVMNNLFKQTIQILTRKKVELYTTEVLVDNIPAIKLYQNQGFKIKNEVVTVVSTSAGNREVTQYEIALEL